MSYEKCSENSARTLEALIVALKTIQGKTKEQQLKGKIVSDFPHFFALFTHFFRIFPQDFPLQNKGF